MLLVEKNKLKKIKMLRKGIKDAKKGKLPLFGVSTNRRVLFILRI